MTTETEKEIANAIRRAAGGIYAVIEESLKKRDDNVIDLTQLNVVLLLSGYADDIEKKGLERALASCPVPSAPKTTKDYKAELVARMGAAVDERIREGRMAH